MRGKQTHYHQNKGKKEEDRDGEEVFCVVGFAYLMRRFPLDKSRYAEKECKSAADDISIYAGCRTERIADDNPNPKPHIYLAIDSPLMSFNRLATKAV